ncbi:MAG TPA: dephospho-CoA kinase [Stenotrophobium sp.]|nr:dephospho-CoA kinase [Stenotrophobium sp.]
MPALTIGLTGGIASGKSLVGDHFEKLGVPVLDADQVSREVVLPGSPALAELVRHFGPDILDEAGQLNRRRMRERVFGDVDARRQLEAILHPHISRRLRAWRDAQTAPYAILSVAILLESGMHELVDRVLVVDTPPETQLERLRGRDNIDETLARQMLAAQLPREQRLKAAHDVILNSRLPAETLAQVERLHRTYLQLATAQ